QANGPVHIPGTYNPRRPIVAMTKLVSSRAQHRAQDRFDALERPALRQHLIDQRIEAALLPHHARNDVAKEGRLGGQILRTLDLATDPMALELGEDVVQARAGDVHLVERLHRRQPRGAAAAGPASVLRRAGADHDSPRREAAL